MADVRKLKDGTILRYKSGLLGKKWKECWAVLFSDSSFCWYDKRTDNRPAGSVLLKDVVPYTCVGLMCDRMPVRRPELPDQYSVHHLVGIGMDPQASKVHWFLFSSDSDLESWFTEIMKTLPRPNLPPSGGQQQPSTGVPSAPPPSYNPPPVYPSQPPSVAPTYPAQTGYNPQQPSAVYAGGAAQYGSTYGGGVAPLPQPQTTVIIQDRGGGYGGGGYGGGGYGGYSGGRSSGPGLGTGMLMGSLLGFGLGSVWGGGLGHSGWGYGGCGPSLGYGGMGMGLGGGYTQDNDTFITNNYYNIDSNNDHGTTGASNQTPAITDSTNRPEVTDVSGDDTGGGYDFGGNDVGGADYDGYDVGGIDDFGGVDDFGGGDFSDIGGGGEW